MQPISKAGALALSGVACLTVMVGSVVAPGLPTIARHLGISGTMGWLVTLPSLGVILFSPAAGWIIGRRGAYSALNCGLFLYGALGAACVWLHGPLAVFVDRLLLGAATVLVMAGSTTLIAEFYEGDRRLSMIARQGMAMKLGGVVFLSLGGFLAARSWQLPFLLYLAGWFFLALVVAFVSPAAQERRQTPHPDSDPAPIGLSAVYAAAALSMLSFFTALIILPTRLHEMGLAETHTGFFLSFASLVAVGAALAMPRLVCAIGENTALAVAFSAYVCAHAVFAMSDMISVYVAGAVLLGTGIGLSLPLVNHLTAELSPPPQRGRNLARVTMAVFLGQFLASFMEWLPGGPQVIFALAALIALLAAAGFVTRFPVRLTPSRA